MTSPANYRAARGLLAFFRRTCRLRCPRCGQGPLFTGWFRMHERCASCRLPFQRGPGFYLGSIYFNYGVTALFVTVAYITLLLATDVPVSVVFWSLAAFCLLFPLWFFRYARGLWLAMDEYFDPQAAQE